VSDAVRASGSEVPFRASERLFVGEDIGDIEESLSRLTQALWMAMGGVLLLGATGGLIISRNLERSMGRLNTCRRAVRDGDLKARAQVRGREGSGDELDELGRGLNGMLDRLEASMASIRHAGDAIAHDLRSPLTRMRAKLEVALIDAEAGKVDGR
jgi:methyl-accepting chemotaxis protein